MNDKDDLVTVGALQQGAIEDSGVDDVRVFDRLIVIRQTDGTEVRIRTRGCRQTAFLLKVLLAAVGARWE